MSEGGRGAALEVLRRVVVQLSAISFDVSQFPRWATNSNRTVARVAAADVARIEAQTRDVVEKMKIEVQKIAAQGESTLSRGKAAAAVIEATMKFIPESDTAARAKAIDMLKTLVAEATGEGGNRDQK